MGINAVILSWMGELAGKGVFKGHSSVLELGPQDSFFPKEHFARIAIKQIGREAGEACAARHFDPAVPYRAQREAFYQALGLSRYRSADVYDDRADYPLDLNSAQCAPEPFDVVVDCGTTEHVYNAGNVFVFTHNTLPAGGVTLKVLPTFGDNTHGFYNIHPTVYFDIARVNGYEILDFRYIDSMSARGPDETFSFLDQSEFELSLKSFAGCQALQEKITRRFGVSVLQAQSSGAIRQSHGTVDYCFVAMRKLRSAPFRYPGQGVYLSEFPDTSGRELASHAETAPTDLAKAADPA